MRTILLLFVTASAFAQVQGGGYQVPAAGGTGSGTVTNITTGCGTTGGVITTTGTISGTGPCWAAGGGTAQAQTATFSPAVVLADGLEVCWKPTAANSGAAPTFAPNGLTAHTIVKAGGALVANDIITTAQACAIYNTTGTQWELQNPQTAIACTTCVTSAASLTSTALMTGAGSQASQTPSATATMDSSGNISTPGTVTAGSGSASHYTDLPQGSDPGAAAVNTIRLFSPVSITSYRVVMPSAAATGFRLWTNSSNMITETIVGTTGSGNVVLASTPTITTPVLAGATATGDINLAGASTHEVPVAANAAPTTNGGVAFDSTNGRWGVGALGTTLYGLSVICNVSTGGQNSGNGNAANMLSSDAATYNTLTSTLATSQTAFGSTCTLPANLFTANRVVLVYAVFVVTAGGTAAAHAFAAKLGATQIWTGTSSTGGTSLTNRQAAFTLMLNGTAAASGSAYVEAISLGGQGALNSQAYSFSSTFPPGGSALATNGSLVLSLLDTMGSQAGNMIQLRSLVVMAGN